MTCREVIDFLSDYLDGTLPWSERSVFLVHLGLCRDCRNYLASFRHAMSLARAESRNLDADQLPPLPPEFLQAIQAAKR